MTTSGKDLFRDVGDPAAAGPGAPPARLFLALDGYEGPIDVLLELARAQKVDLTQISVLELAEQYLCFIGEAQTLNLEIAADTLVMAAWLAYLKSRLLLPDADSEPDCTTEEMVDALRLQLRRLEAMRIAGQRLMARPRLGIDVFPRGLPETVADRTHAVYELSLFELLRAYAEQRLRGESADLRIEPLEFYTVEDALARLWPMLASVPRWQSLFSFLPDGLRDGLPARSAVVSTLLASLELAKDGEAELCQRGRFEPIYLRARRPER